ncbi:hypothetical protein pb186bvf_007402 [Paramecium bursaria]
MSLDAVFLGYYGNIDQMNEMDVLSTRYHAETHIRYAIFLKVSTAGSSLILFSLFLIALFQFQFTKSIKVGIFIILTIGVVLIIFGISYGNFYYQELEIEYFNQPVGYGIAQILIYLIAVIELLDKDSKDIQVLKVSSTQ